MSKKIISLAIAILMVAIMLPTSIISASATDKVYQFRYDFSEVDGANGNLDTVTFKTTGGKWARSSYVFKKDWTKNDQVKYNRLNLYTAGGNAWVALEINVPVSGTYDVRYDYVEIGASSATGDVYVFPAGTTLTQDVKFGTDVNNIASSGTKIATGIVYNNASGTTTPQHVIYENLSLTAGKNLVVFVATAGGYAYPSALTLTTADASSTDYSDTYVGYVDVAKKTLDAEISETTTATVAAYKMSDKSAIESGITFKSSNEAVATVAEDGTITAHKAGTATIFAVCENPAVGNIFGTDITVTASTYKVAYTFDNRVILTEETNLAGVTDYAHTKGMWKYYTMHNNDGICYLKNNRLEIRTKGVGGYAAIAINVPKTDVYDVEYFHYGVASRGGIGDVYIIPGGTSLSDIGAAKAAGTKIATVDYASIANGTKASAGVAKKVSVSKGENIILFEMIGTNNTDATYGYAMYPSALVFTNSAGLSSAEELETVYVGTVAVDKSELEVDGSAKATATVYTADTTDDGVADGVAVTSGITYASSDTEVATVDATTGAIIAVGEGRTTISANIEDGSIIGTDITVNPKPDFDYVSSFDAVVEDYITSGNATVNVYTYAGTEDSYSLNNVVDLGKTYAASAPEIEDYHFLYWAKGASSKKQIVSYSKSFDFKPHEGANYLVAVYEKDGEETAKAEFYNANGDLIDTLTANGKAPALPSMPGYGKSSGWILYGDETKTEYAANADITVSGTMIFVANYDELASVTVNGKEYTYGDTVTLTAEIPGGKVFKGWKKNGEIVSVDSTYTFLAYENCDAEAIYAEVVPVFTGKFVKIVIDSFAAGDETAVMAEFIGIDNAIEKGIMVGNNKIAMKGNGNQFSIIADVEDTTYVGYAILKDGTAFTQITDGEYTK